MFWTHSCLYDVNALARIYFYRHEFYDLRQLSCRVNVGIDQGMDRSSSQSDKDKINKAADHMINDLGS